VRARAAKAMLLQSWVEGRSAVPVRGLRLHDLLLHEDFLNITNLLPAPAWLYTANVACYKVNKCALMPQNFHFAILFEYTHVTLKMEQIFSGRLKNTSYFLFACIFQNAVVFFKIKFSCKVCLLELIVQSLPPVTTSIHTKLKNWQK